MRLSIEISPEQHYQIKAMAALSGKTIRDLVLEKVFGDDKDDTAWEELLSFLDKRITHAENGGVSSKTLDQIAEKILQRHNVV